MERWEEKTGELKPSASGDWGEGKIDGHVLTLEFLPPPELKIFISLGFFDIDTKFQFFGDIQVASRTLYTTSRFCMKMMRDARNIWQLRNSLIAYASSLYLFVPAQTLHRLHPLLAVQLEDSPLRSQ